MSKLRKILIMTFIVIISLFINIFAVNGENEKVSVEIKKLAGDDFRLLPGAKFRLTNDKGEQNEWDDTTGLNVIELSSGQYTLEEIKAPDGYNLATNVVFTVDSQLNKIVVTSPSGEKIEMQSNVLQVVDFKKNNNLISVTDSKKKYEVKIDKVDSESNASISGALLSIFDSSTNDMIDQWQSNGASHSVNLISGIYKLNEESAPGGYNTAESISFRVSTDGKVFIVNTQGGSEIEQSDNTIKMIDVKKKYEVKIDKVDAESNDYLVEAKLNIVSANNSENVIDEWSTNPESHTVKLEPGSYILNETTAPVGYELAESIPFQIDQEGKIIGQDSNIIKITNKKKKYEIEIEKIDADSRERLAGAKLKLTGTSNDIIEEWETTKETHKISLEYGEYELTETVAPKGYDLATSISFEIDKEGNLNITESGGERIKKKIT